VALSEFEGDGFTVHEQAGPHVWFLILNAKEWKKLPGNTPHRAT
jgi:hypothetical protein